MRPRNIEVFDGLRITTDHINHLQGAVHSALEDIRAILGLGRVHRGFEVLPVDGQRVTLMPGLAFDARGNRLVSDEPVTLEVPFGPDESTTFLCLEYDQVETGEVEGRPTLVWDSCAAVFVPSLADAAETLLPIAQLNRQDDGAIEVVSLLAASSNEVEEQSSEASAAAPEEAPAGSEESDAPVDAAAAYTNGSTAAGWRLQVRQGVVRLGAYGAGEIPLSALLEPLRELARRGDAGAGAEIRVPLDEVEVALDFAAASLTLDTTITASIVAVGAVADGAGPTDAEAAGEAALRLRAMARGEATFDGAELAQHGSSMVWPAPAAGGSPWPWSEVTEAGIAAVPFGQPNAGVDPGASGVLQPKLSLLVDVARVDAQGFVLRCSLCWEGGATDELMQTIEDRSPALGWEALVAWKAFGELPSSA